MKSSNVARRIIAFLTTALLLSSSSAWAQNADFNGSRLVDLQDFFAFADVFGEEVTDINSRFDLNSDGAIDLFDFFLFADQFGDEVLFAEDILTADLPGGATMEFVWIEPGTFMMGSPKSEQGRTDSDEGPQHEVTITQGFYLGRYEITQSQWEAVMGTRPWFASYGTQHIPDNPATYVSWLTVQEFAERLNQANGEELYRLPTEAEWEYACRAGTTTPWSFGDDESQLGDYAWYKDNTWDAGMQYPQPVGKLLPNPWGLSDMHGNVREWVQDWYWVYPSDSQVDPQGPATGSRRVLRNGYYLHSDRFTRSAKRYGYSIGYNDSSIGARLLRTGPPPQAVAPEDLER